MTAPAPDPEALHVNIGVTVVKNHPSGAPVIAVIFPMGGARFAWELDARNVPNTLAGLTKAMMTAAQEAITLAGPQIVTPAAGLILPNGAQPLPRNGQHP